MTSIHIHPLKSKNTLLLCLPFQCCYFVGVAYAADLVHCWCVFHFSASDVPVAFYFFLASVHLPNAYMYLVFNFLLVIFIDNHLLIEKKREERREKECNSKSGSEEEWIENITWVGLLRQRFINTHKCTHFIWMYNINIQNCGNKQDIVHTITDFSVKTQLHMQTNGRKSSSWIG